MYLEGQPNLTDEFDLLYVRGVHGWSDLHVVTRHPQIAVRISHIFSDPIEELSELCCGLLRGEPRFMARLPDEPGGAVVTASIYAEQKHIAHIEFWTCRDWDDHIEFWTCRGWDDIPPRGTSILSADAKVRQFVGLLYRQFEKVRWLSEERSYLKRRDPFPHAAFETLQRLWLKSSRRTKPLAR
jgi:hypothetical protein